MNRLVIEPSVLLSAIVGHPDAPPAILLDAVHSKAVEAIACPELIAEVRDNLLHKPYFRARSRPGDARKAIAEIERITIMLTARDVCELLWLIPPS